jgi:hypothetical protein
MVIRTPQTRSKNLFDYFGWQGGTIHQIADETDVNVSDLLYGLPLENHLTSKYVQGQCAAETCGQAMRLKLAKETKGNRDFWIGVAMAVK